MGLRESMGLGGMNLPRSNALRSEIIWVRVGVSRGGSSSPNADARSIKATLARRTRARSSSDCAIARARSSKMGSSVSPAIWRGEFVQLFRKLFA